MVLLALGDEETHVHFLPVAPHLRRGHFHIHVAAALVEVADRRHVGVEQLGIHPPCAAREIVQQPFFLRLDDLADFFRGQRAVAFDGDRPDRRLAAFVDGESHMGRAQLFAHVGLVAHRHFGEALVHIVFDDLLLVRLEARLVQRVARLGADLFADAALFHHLHAGEHHLGDLRLRLHDHDHFHPVLHLLAENADVGKIARRVKIADVLLHNLLGIRPAHPRPHVGEELFFAHRARAGVLHLDRPHDRHDRRDRSRRRSPATRHQRRGRRQQLAVERGGLGQHDGKRDNGGDNGTEIHGWVRAVESRRRALSRRKAAYKRGCRRERQAGF